MQNILMDSLGDSVAWYNRTHRGELIIPPCLFSLYLYYIKNLDCAAQIHGDAHKDKR